MASVSLQLHKRRLQLQASDLARKQAPCAAGLRSEIRQKQNTTKARLTDGISSHG